jgi:hypothetical protein
MLVGISVVIVVTVGSFRCCSVAMTSFVELRVVVVLVIDVIIDGNTCSVVVLESKAIRNVNYDLGMLFISFHQFFCFSF